MELTMKLLSKFIPFNARDAEGNATAGANLPCSVKQSDQAQTIKGISK
jgi:hypothetical protein